MSKLESIIKAGLNAPGMTPPQPAAPPTAEVEARAADAAMARLQAACALPGIAGDPGRMKAAMDLCAKYPALSGEDIGKLVLDQVAAAGAGIDPAKYEAQRLADQGHDGNLGSLASAGLFTGALKAVGGDSWKAFRDRHNADVDRQAAQEATHRSGNQVPHSGQQPAPQAAPAQASGVWGSFRNRQADATGWKAVADQINANRQ